MQELETSGHRESNGETAVNISNEIVNREHQAKWNYCGGFCLAGPLWNYLGIMCTFTSAFKVGLWNILSHFLYILVFHYMWKRSPASLPERKISCIGKYW